MSELIKRPDGLSRVGVQKALSRLSGAPSRTRIEAMMRLVDEYAATCNTRRVYAHAERIAEQALVDAWRAMERGEKIFVCGCENFSGEKFFDEESPKKIFKGDPHAAPEPVAVAPDAAIPANQDEPGQTGADEANRASATDAADSADAADGTDPACDDMSGTGDISRGVGIEDDTDRKWCPRCGRWLDRADFTRNRSRADGLSTACRSCESVRGADYRSRVRAILSAWRAEHPRR